MVVPRLVIAGAQSGVGKTTLTLGLLGALKDEGYRVRPFKVGPDYIDPGLHEAACGVPSHNLDSWMGDEEIVKKVFCLHGSDADIAVIEGVMGLYDGARGEREKGSTAHVAKILKAPVILLVNARGMARSCAALIKGYRDFDPRLNLAGVIFNNVGSESHALFLEGIVREEIGIPCLGFIRRNRELFIPERYLGLLPAPENKRLKSQIKTLAASIKEGINLPLLIKIAKNTPPLSAPSKAEPLQEEVHLGVAWDEAFNFYYRDSIAFLEELGARVTFFSPLEDKCLPKVQGLYFGGGFPEMFLEKLAANEKMRRCIKEVCSRDIPLYAECGGFMYLLEELVDFEGKCFAGAGVIPGRVKMTESLAALGYVKACLLKDTLLAGAGDILKGHEFHWSEMEGLPSEKSAYCLIGGKGNSGRLEGYADGNIMASYVHLHFRSNPKAAINFLKNCREWGEQHGP